MKLAAFRRRVDDRGEAPVMVLVGMVVILIVALAAAASITSLSQSASITRDDRRLDKALATHLETLRSQPWQTWAPGTKATHELDLAGTPVEMTLWVSAITPSTLRLTAAATPHDIAGDVDCHASTTGTDLDPLCVTASAVVAAQATDLRLPTSPGVALTPGASGSTGVTLAEGSTLLTANITQPTRVAVVARTDRPVTYLSVVGNGLTRALVKVEKPQGSGDWAFGNVVVCPSWSRGAVTVATSTLHDLRNVTPRPTANATKYADTSVLLTPAPASACK